MCGDGSVFPLPPFSRANELTFDHPYLPPPLPYQPGSPSYTGTENYGCVWMRLEAGAKAPGARGTPIILTSTPAPPTAPLPHTRHPPCSYGIFMALNRTHATWSFKTVKADGGGPADYSDYLTIVRAH